MDSRMVERRAARPWPVSWSAIWLGAFAAVVAVVLFGFMGVAVGAQATGQLSFKGTGLIALAWAVFAVELIAPPRRAVSASRSAAALLRRSRQPRATFSCSR